jgi:glycerate kinase
MALRVLVVPDKFKGTLRAGESVSAIVEGWRAVRPGDTLDELPMSDGGDGFGEVIGGLVGAVKRTCPTLDSAHRSRDAAWWFEPATRVAVIETAEVNGLALLPPGRYHPFELDTFGLGALLRAAADARALRVYAGLGGSATNDGAFGLARALGFVFRDVAGTHLESFTELERLATIERPSSPLVFGELTIAVDVTNPLLGPDGATRVFGPQKGLLSSDLPKAEACLGRLAALVDAGASEPFSVEAGAGAAGGLGFGLRAFVGGRLESGAALFARLADLEQRVLDADLVVTGEGTLDRQSFSGKGVGMVVAAAARAGKPCWCFTGANLLDPGATASSSFRAFSIVPDVAPTARALSSAFECLRDLAKRAASTLGVP